jgi:hypothetical protein
MRRLALPTSAALLGLCAVGLVGGDPRATHDVGTSWNIVLAGLVLSVGVGVLAWLRGRARAGWLLVPTVILAVMGGLSGWIAGAELTHAPDTAVHLSGSAGRVVFMLVLTTLGMALPAVGLVSLVGRFRRPDRART